jgi:anti-anti-sigma factor
MKLKGIRNRQDPGAVHYRFEGDITIYTVDHLKKILMDELKENSRVELDLQGIKKFDSAGFQLFFYLKREALKNGKKIEVIQKSPGVSRIFDLFDIEV